MTTTCARHADELATAHCARCAQPTCLHCLRGTLCLGCSLEATKRSGGSKSFLLVAVLLGIGAGGVYALLRQGSVDTPTVAPTAPQETSQRFPQHGVALTTSFPVASERIGRVETIIVRSSPTRRLLAIHSKEIYPWADLKLLGERHWRWAKGDVRLESGQERPFDGDWAITTKIKPLLILVAHGRMLLVSSPDADLFSPEVWSLVRSIEVLPGTSIRDKVTKGLSAEQAKAPPPSDLLAKLDATAAALEEGFPQRPPLVSEGMRLLKERSLDHGDALALQRLFLRASAAMERQARAHSDARPEDDGDR